MIDWCPTVWALQFPNFQYLWYVSFNNETWHNMLFICG